MQVKIKKLSSNALIPKYHSIGAAGADIYACLKEDITIFPMQTSLIPTGIALEIPEGYEIQIRPRSGLATKGIILPNSPGTIDSDYRGEIKIILMNLSEKPFTIKNHDRIAQMILSKFEKIEFIETEELLPTQRGEGGFGSTGSNKG